MITAQALRLKRALKALGLKASVRTEMKYRQETSADKVTTKWTEYGDATAVLYQITSEQMAALIVQGFQIADSKSMFPDAKITHFVCVRS